MEFSVRCPSTTCVINRYSPATTPFTCLPYPKQTRPSLWKLPWDKEDFSDGHPCLQTLLLSKSLWQNDYIQVFFFFWDLHSLVNSSCRILPSSLLSTGQVLLIEGVTAHGRVAGTRAQNQRSVRAGRDFKDHLVSITCQGQWNLLLELVAPSNLALNISKVRASTTTLGNL